jgi:Ni,Fe-hydrogenase III small subunit
VRGSLIVFVLLKKLQEIKADAATGAPPRRTSLALRHVDVGSCNGCEHELQNASNAYYDLARFGLSLVASPRHADVLLITGPVTRRMVEPLQRAYEAMPEPRLVAALGDCALGCNVLGESSELVGSVERVLPVDIRIPGCPPAPSAIAAAILAAAP